MTDSPFYSQSSESYRPLARKALQAVFEADSTSAAPVIQFVSPEFWKKFDRWFHLFPQQALFGTRPFIIALSGASGSGKSFISESLVEKITLFSQVASFTLDNYYVDFEALYPDIPVERFYNEVNLDDPAHIRFDKLVADLQAIHKLPHGNTYLIPKLRFGTPTRKPTIIEAATEVDVEPFLVTEGIHAFYHRDAMTLYDLKIFVEVDETVRKQRWLERNLRDNRGTTENMWNTTVDCLERHLLAAREHADLIISNNASQSETLAFLDTLVRTLCNSFETYYQTPYDSRSAL